MFIIIITNICKVPTEIKRPFLLLPPSSTDVAVFWWWVGFLALFGEGFLLGFQFGGRERRFGVQRRG